MNNNSQIQERNVSFGKIGTIFKKRISKENNLFFNIRTLIFMNDILSNGKIIDTDINVNLSLGIFPSPMSKYYKSGMLLNIEDCLNLKRMFDAFKAGKLNEIVYKKESKIFKGDAQITEVINFGIQKANNNGGFWARIGSFNPHTNEHYDYYDFQIYANDIVRLSNIISSFDQVYNRIYFQLAADMAFQELRGGGASTTTSNMDTSGLDGFYGNSGFQTSGTYRKSNNPQQVQNDPNAKNTDTLKQYNQQYDANCDVAGKVQESSQPNNGLGFDIDFTSNLPIDDEQIPNVDFGAISAEQMEIHKDISEEIQQGVMSVNEQASQSVNQQQQNIENNTQFANNNVNQQQQAPIQQDIINEEPQCNSNMSSLLNDVSGFMIDDNEQEEIVSAEIQIEQQTVVSKVNEENKREQPEYAPITNEPEPEHAQEGQNVISQEIVNQTDMGPMGGAIETVKQKVEIQEEPTGSLQKNTDAIADTLVVKVNDNKKYQYVYTEATNQLIQAFTNSLGCEQETNEYGVRYILPFFPTADNSFSTVRQLSNNIGNFGISSYVFDPNLYFVFTLHIQYMLSEMKGKIETNIQLNESNFDPVEIKGLYLIFMNWFKITHRVKGDDVVFNSDEIEIGERLIEMFEMFVKSKEVRDKCYDSVFLKEVA